jgi:hypothetical protein
MYSSVKRISNSNDLSLHEALKNSYSKNPKETMKGYVLDKGLSNDNQQVYYNKNKIELLMSVAGTHKPADFVTDFFLGIGRLKNTNRYKEADKILKTAKSKYKPMKTNLVGHSLGHSIASNIGSRDDNILGLNGGYTIGQSTRDNVKHFRNSGDVVSTFGNFSSNTRQLANPNYRTGIFAIDALRAHNVDNIINSGIVV